MAAFRPWRFKSSLGHPLRPLVRPNRLGVLQFSVYCRTMSNRATSRHVRRTVGARRSPQPGLTSPHRSRPESPTPHRSDRTDHAGHPGASRSRRRRTPGLRVIRSVIVSMPSTGRIRSSRAFTRSRHYAGASCCPALPLHSVLRRAALPAQDTCSTPSPICDCSGACSLPRTAAGRSGRCDLGANHAPPAALPGTPHGRGTPAGRHGLHRTPAP